MRTYHYLTHLYTQLSRKTTTISHIFTIFINYFLQLSLILNYNNYQLIVLNFTLQLFLRDHVIQLIIVTQ